MRDLETLLTLRRTAASCAGSAPAVLGLCALVLLLGGCAGGIPPRDAGSATEAGTWGDTDLPTPTGLQFVLSHENLRAAPYYPFEGLAGVEFATDGTLYVCDEQGGRIHGWDPALDEWFQFDTPLGRFFRPVDVHTDGFNVLVLDMDGGELLRYDLAGVFLDRIVDFAFLDPGYDRLPSAFDVDVDGRIVVCDAREEQVLVLDNDLNLDQMVGHPGSHRGQFREPSGVCFQLDGGFVVADRANRRLQAFNRLGSLTGEAGGEFEPRNPMLTPQGVDRDEFGNIFVADVAGGAIHAFAEDLTFLFTISSELGLLESPASPVDVAVGAHGLLAVSDRGREAVLIYRILYR